MQPNQIADYRVPSDIRYHPSEEKAVFVVTTMNLSEDRYDSQIWMWNGHDVFPITHGVADTSPRWSPDGGNLAFLTKGDDPEAKPQIAFRTGFDAVAVVTEFSSGVKEFSWSPDGSQIVAGVQEFTDGHDSDADRARAPRRITAPAFRFDNKGWTYNVRTHLWSIEVSTRTASRLTEGDFSVSGPAWAPDGSEIAFVTSDDPRRWISSLNRVFVLDLGSGNIESRSPIGQWNWVGYDADGSLLGLGVPTATEALLLSQLWKLDGDPVGFAAVDMHITSEGIAGAGSLPQPSDDGTVWCIAEDRGAQVIVSVGESGSRVIASGKRAISSFASDTGRDEILLTYSTPTEPGAVGKLVGGAEEAITHLNDVFVEAAGLVEPDEFVFESDGAQIHGWVFLPEGNASVPVLFNIHGGPAAQYSWGFFDEFQVYVGAGYGVVAVNPRGSSGYGYEHVRAPVGRWGDEVPPDHLDLRSAPYEAAKRFERLDLDRLGIMGGSYGGLSTVMVTSMDDRYRSAVAERGVYNWVSFAGTSDIPWFVERYLEAGMPADADTLWRASTLSRAHRITSPTLVIHSEHDFRCPVEQGQQLFSLLYANGVDTELLLFPPEEGHELSRSGKPKHRVERFEAILEWHARHLT